MVVAAMFPWAHKDSNPVARALSAQGEQVLLLLAAFAFPAAFSFALWNSWPRDQFRDLLPEVSLTKSWLSRYSHTLHWAFPVLHSARLAVGLKLGLCPFAQSFLLRQPLVDLFQGRGLLPVFGEVRELWHFVSKEPQCRLSTLGFLAQLLLLLLGLWVAFHVGLVLAPQLALVELAEADLDLRHRLLCVVGSFCKGLHLLHQTCLPAELLQVEALEQRMDEVILELRELRTLLLDRVSRPSTEAGQSQALRLAQGPDVRCNGEATGSDGSQHNSLALLWKPAADASSVDGYTSNLCLSFKDPSTQLPAAEAQASLRRAATLVREMLQLGWEMTPARNARLLLALGKATAEGGREASLARFTAALLQMQDEVEVAKALRSAKEQLKLGKKGLTENGDKQPIVIHIAASHAGNAKDSGKAMKVLEALGVTVLGLGMGDIKAGQPLCPRKASAQPAAVAVAANGMAAHPRPEVGATAAARLRRLLAERQEIIVMPCCYDGLTARLVERMGFELTFMTGFGVSAVHGFADCQLVSYQEMLEAAFCICGSLERICCIADGDTGYGNAVNVKRTVRGYAQAGMSGVMIEDQVAPKRCGHTKGTTVVSRPEAVARIKAACDARDEGPWDICIMARTDARASLGLDEAIARCKAFVEAGADITFLEAPRSEEEMIRYCAETPGYKMVNMLPSGKTPFLPHQRLHEIGYAIAAYPLTLLSAGLRHGGILKPPVGMEASCTRGISMKPTMGY
eukprot:s501_g1.t1